MRKLVFNIPESADDAGLRNLLSELKKFGVDAEIQESDERYEPQVGDFVAFMDDSQEEPFIGIFKEWYCGSKDKIVCFAHINEQGELDDEEEYWRIEKLFRPATDEEKEELIKELARDKRKWNPETKEFEECETYEAIRCFKDALEKVRRLSEAHQTVHEKPNVFSDLLFAYDHLVDIVDQSYMENETNCDVIAFIKLRIIVAAINEGWTPQFTADEYRWFPWFALYTKEEIDNMSEKDREERGLSEGSRVVARSGSGAYTNGGVAFVHANSDSSYTSSDIGSRLAFSDKRRARYAGRQFLELYRDLNFLRPIEEGKTE